MKTATTEKSTLFMLLAVLCLTILPMGHAFSESRVLLDDCLNLQFKDDANLQRDAYRIGQCYLTLASQNKLPPSSGESGLNSKYPFYTVNGFSSFAYLQYADSWFQLAARMEHPLANESRARVSLLLDVLNREYLTQR